MGKWRPRDVKDHPLVTQQELEKALAHKWKHKAIAIAMNFLRPPRG